MVFSIRKILLLGELILFLSYKKYAFILLFQNAPLKEIPLQDLQNNLQEIKML